RLPKYSVLHSYEPKNLAAKLAVAVAPMTSRAVPSDRSKSKSTELVAKLTDGLTLSPPLPSHSASLGATAGLAADDAMDSPVVIRMSANPSSSAAGTSVTA